MYIKRIDITKFILLFILGIFFVGCTSTPSPVKVLVDSYVGTQPSGDKVYYLEQGYKDGIGGELARKNFALEIDLMLYGKGYKKVFEKKSAKYIISFDYGTEGPFIRERISTRPVRMGIGLGYGYRRWGGHGAYYNGFIGDDIFFTDVIERSEYYRKYLIIRARNLKGDPLWEVTAVNNNSLSDIRTVFPYLVRGAGHYIERDSGAVITVDIPPLENSLQQ